MKFVVKLDEGELSCVIANPHFLQVWQSLFERSYFFEWIATVEKTTSR